MTVLNRICTLWLKRGALGAKVAKAWYKETPRRIRRYYDKPECFLFQGDDGLLGGSRPEDEPFPTGRPEGFVQVAKVGDWVHRMMAFIAQSAPHRLVSPRLLNLSPEILAYAYNGQPPPPGPTPDEELACALQQYVLNYTAEDGTFNVRGETRLGLRDALLDGRGVLWHELIETPLGTMPGSFYDTHRNLVYDPDSDNPRDALWIRRTRRRPIWKIARDFKLDEKELRGKYQSSNAKAAEEVDEIPRHGHYWGDYADEDSRERDIGLYYEFYSRMGIGQHLLAEDEELERAAAVFDAEQVYLAIMPGMEYPLNLPPDAFRTESEDEIRSRLDWPIAWFADYEDPWPCSVLDFLPNGLYPKPPLEDALPLQAFIDYAYSFLMGHVKWATRQIVTCFSGMEDALEQAIKSGAHLSVVPVSDKVDDLQKQFYVIQFPPVNPDLWRIIREADGEWENRTGLTELAMGGQSRQIRSSAEAQIRQSNLSIIPNDLADTVKAWHSQIARKEGAMQRLVIREDTAARLFKEKPPSETGGIMSPLTEAWMRLNATDDPGQAFGELQYSVEAGAGRRKNLESLLATINDSASAVFPVLAQVYFRTGDPMAINQWLRQWADARQTEPVILPPLQMQPPAGAPGAEGAEPVAPGPPAPETEAGPPVPGA